MSTVQIVYIEHFFFTLSQGLELIVIGTEPAEDLVSQAKKTASDTDDGICTLLPLVFLISHIIYLLHSLRVCICMFCFYMSVHAVGGKG